MTGRRVAVWAALVGAVGWWRRRRRGAPPFPVAALVLWWHVRRAGGQPEPVRSGPPHEAMP